MSHRRARLPLHLAVLLAVALAVSAPAEPVRVTVDPHTTRSIGGVSELDRTAYFSVCDPATRFDQRMKSEERVAYLLNDLDVSFGRRLGPVKGLWTWKKAIEEDPERPGFADLDKLRAHLKTAVKPPSATLAALAGGKTVVAAHGQHNGFPPFMGEFYSEHLAKKDKKEYLPENIAASAELAAVVMAEGYTDFDRPRFYEPLNEPHWSYHGTQHLADWHVAVRRAVKAAAPSVKVGGYCSSVAYFYRRNFGAFNGLKGFIDRTDAQLDFYSFHVYDFLNWNGEGFRGRLTGGLPLEGVLDLVQNHAVNAHGRGLDLVVSEHGGYITGGSGPKADAVGALLGEKHFPELEGFARTMRERSVSSFILVNAVIKNTLTFMDHPRVLKAVPFILPEAMGWDPTYHSVLYVPRHFTDKNDWVETRNLDFYKLFRDLRGRRVVVRAGDPDVQARAFVEGARLQLVLNNLSEVPQALDLELPPGHTAATTRRYGRNADFTPYLREEDGGGAGPLTLAPLETVLVTLTYPEPIAASGAVEETAHYGDQIRVELKGDAVARFRVETPDASDAAYATLRVALTRPPGADPGLTVVLNGQRLDAPVEDAAPLLTSPEGGKGEFATTRIVPIDPALLKDVNAVEVQFPGDEGGAIGAVVIRCAQKRKLQK